MPTIIELCEQGYNPKSEGSIKKILKSLKNLPDNNKKEIRIYREDILIKSGNKKKFYLYTKE